MENMVKCFKRSCVQGIENTVFLDLRSIRTKEKNLDLEIGRILIIFNKTCQWNADRVEVIGIRTEKKLLSANFMENAIPQCVPTV